MDNKLSELSKPYGYEYVTAGRGHVVMSRTLPPVDMREVKPLYSQEYVSSLIADNEALKIRVGQQQSVAANNLDMFRNADARAESLLAELEASKTNAEYYKSAFEEQRDHADMLEKRLATPVRLPEKFSMLHRTDFHEDYHSTMAFKSDEVFDAIRAAGFRCEGDEQ